MVQPLIPRWCPDDTDRDRLDLARLTGLAASDVQPPADLVESGRAAGALVVTDAEGTPVARYNTDADGLFANPEWLSGGAPRPFEALFVPAAHVASAAPAGERAVLVDRRLGADDVAVLAAEPSPLLLVVSAGPSHATHGPAWPIVRSAVAAARSIPGARVVALPVTPGHPVPPSVLDAYGVTDLFTLPATPPAPSFRGTVVLFTGLSGAGKSTLARAVRDWVVETSETPVSLLDGDVVRRSLSSELGFSPADRETNVRRIGWVAATIAHHGGLVLCSPIAPYASTRHEVRADAQRAGVRFVLVYVATPLSECERRDSKGMYRRARAGEIADFTGVSAPYEEPTDADLVIDTTGLSITQARDQVLGLLSAC